MKVIRVGGAYGLLLSSEEYGNILECVEAYCIGAVGPEMEPDPDVAEAYPGERISPPVPQKFWQLHATLATRKARGKSKESPTSGTNG